MGLMDRVVSAAGDDQVPLVVDMNTKVPVANFGGLQCG